MISLNFVILLIALIFSFSIGPIQCQSSNDKPGYSLHSTDEFSIENGNVFQLQNIHRTLNFSLIGGARISPPPNKGDSESIWVFRLDDGSVMEMEIRKIRSGTEWHFVWNGAGKNVNREVCFNYGSNKTKWFNTYQSATPTYPMDPSKDLPRTQFGFHSFISNYPNGEFYGILEYLFLNSDGFAILLDPKCPWFIRYSAQNKANPFMCFSAHNEFPYAEQITDPTAYLSLKFSIFAAANIRAVHEHVMSPQLGHIPKLNQIPEDAYFQDWTFGTFGEQDKNDFYYSDSLERFSQLDESKIDYSEYLNRLSGNEQELNRNFPSFGQAPIEDLEEARFKSGMIVHGIVRNNHKLSDDYFVKERFTNSRTKLIDFSNSKARKMFSKKLIKNSNEISTFFFTDFSVKFSNGWAFGLNDSTVQMYPNFYWKNYLETSSGISASNHFITTSIGFRTQNLPVFIRPSNFHSKNADQILQEFLKNILAISLGGYSFIDSYVGSLNSIPPTSEQYIRWIQASTPLPHLTLSRLPMSYNDDPTVDEIVRKFIKLHREEYSPVIIKLAKSRLQDGLPIIRPMWYGAPLDPNALDISDQYMLGEDIVVAPVLFSGQRDRLVYLPEGEWQDHRGVQRSGPGFCKVDVRLDELAVFKRFKPPL